MDNQQILAAIKRRLGASGGFAEVSGMFFGVIFSLAGNAVIWTGLYALVVWKLSYGHDHSFADHPVGAHPLGYGHGLSFDVTTGVLVVLGTLLSMVGAKAGRSQAIGRTVGQMEDSRKWFNRGENEVALGWLGSILDFLGGSLVGCVEYFLHGPLLTRNQCVIATGVVSCCLQQPGENLNAVHDSIMHADRTLTEVDFERTLSVLRGKGIIAGQSHLTLIPEFHRELNG
ncbi:MAG TPA: hypothetical protein VGO93_17830 [Candidatus Xenobia bacterium]